MESIKKYQKEYDKINELIQKYVLENNNKPKEQKRFVSQFQTFVEGEFLQKSDDFQLQGWKLHISATDLKDYAELLDVILPELQEKNIRFKIVQPDCFDSFMNSSQCGKLVTIYLDKNFNMDCFSARFQEKLMEPSIAVDGELNIFGRTFARYGRFRDGSDYITEPNGKKIKDERGIIGPAFLKDCSEKEIFSFYNDIESAFYETGDAKTFLQESLLMARCDGKSHAYFIYQFEPNLWETMNIVLQECDYSSLSFINRTEKDGDCYLMLHSNNNYTLCDELMDIEDEIGDTVFHRPDWDERYNYFLIPDTKIKDVYDVVGKINNKIHPFLPKIQCLDHILKCDTSQYGKLESMLNKREIVLEPIALNVHKSKQHEVLKYYPSNRVDYETGNMNQWELDELQKTLSDLYENGKIDADDYDFFYGIIDSNPTMIEYDYINTYCQKLNDTCVEEEIKQEI